MIRFTLVALLAAVFLPDASACGMRVTKQVLLADALEAIDDVEDDAKEEQKPEAVVAEVDEEPTETEAQPTLIPEVPSIDPSTEGLRTLEPMKKPTS